MKDENDQPNNKCEQTSGKSNEHQPTQHCQRIKKLAIVATADDAGDVPTLHPLCTRACLLSKRTPQQILSAQTRTERLGQAKPNKQPTGISYTAWYSSSRFYIIAYPVKIVEVGRSGATAHFQRHSRAVVGSLSACDNDYDALRQSDCFFARATLSAEED